MAKTFRNREDAQAWQAEHESLAPKVGQMAPDFTLHDAKGENPIRLSDFRGQKPVALVFGSYTWPPFVREAVSLRDLYAAYHTQVQFLVIYIREAHPVDGWSLGDNHNIYDPTTIEARRELAGTCEVSMQYGIRTYVDEMDDAVMTAYAAWPERLYLIGEDGRVRYQGGPGPFGFEPAELKAAIDEWLAEVAASV